MIRTEEAFLVRDAENKRKIQVAFLFNIYDF